MTMLANTCTLAACASPLRHLVSTALGGAVSVIEALDTTFISGFLSNIGAKLPQADAGLLAIGIVFVVFLVARLTEDRRRFAQLSQAGSATGAKT